VINNAPYFIGAHPVSVVPNLVYTDLWNITVACGDWEGIAQIVITYQCFRDNGVYIREDSVIVTATGSNKWIYNGSSYICMVDITQQITTYDIKFLNVTYVAIRDTDYAVVFTDVTYGKAYDELSFNDRQTEVGDIPPPPFCLECLIGALIAIVAGVCAVYAVYYFRKKLSYRRYM
jgi:hypothetical protein